jgi:hypothetical protein
MGKSGCKVQVTRNLKVAERRRKMRPCNESVCEAGYGFSRAFGGRGTSFPTPVAAENASGTRLRAHLVELSQALLQGVRRKPSQDRLEVSRRQPLQDHQFGYCGRGKRDASSHGNGLPDAHIIEETFDAPGITPELLVKDRRQLFGHHQLLGQGKVLF